MDGDFPWIFNNAYMEIRNVNISYVGMHECYMDFMQNLHEKNAFFMDKN